MAEEDKDRRRSLLDTVKAPLIFSFVLGGIAGIVTLIVSFEGPANQWMDHATLGVGNPINLALLAFGIAFIASLLIFSMLQLASRQNPEELSAGSGFTRESEELRRQSLTRPREEERQQKAEEAPQESNGDGQA